MQPFKYKPNISSGNFRHRITIQYPVSTKDELNQTITSWEDLKSVWADIKTLQGREYIAAAAAKAEKNSRFIIRYTHGIDETMRILFKGKIYDIVEPPINDDELDKTLTIIGRMK